VILVDANILIYAFDADSPQHASARRWLDGRLNDTARVALPWPSLLAFLRIVANPRVMQRPAGMELARTSANLAALAIEHGLQVHSTDCARFPGLRWINPLIV
jgi:predicted nucleic acid-binding protein